MKGLLLVHKPLDITSHDVIDKLRKLEDIDKAGHIGTLDPTAEGLLGVLINKATKLSQFMQGLDKEYEIEVEFGRETDTLDQSGEVVNRGNVSEVEKQNLEQILSDFIGKQKQTPPKYSAIKVDGKKLYEYARSDKGVDIPTRDIEIYDLELLNFSNNENTTAKIKLECSSGTYTRSLVRDIGRKLGSFAVQKHLRRTQIGDFLLKDSHSIDEIRKLAADKKMKNILISSSDAVSHLPRVIIKEESEKFIKNGAPVRLKNLAQDYSHNRGEIVSICTKDSELLAIGKFQHDLDAIKDPEQEVIKYKQVLA